MNNKITLSLLSTIMKESLEYGLNIDSLLNNEIYEDYINGFISFIKINNNLNIYRDKTFNRIGHLSSYDTDSTSTENTKWYLVDKPIITIQDCINAFFNSNSKLAADLLEANIPYISVDSIQRLDSLKKTIILNLINLAIQETENAYNLVARYKQEWIDSFSKLSEDFKTNPERIANNNMLLEGFNQIESLHKDMKQHAKLIQFLRSHAEDNIEYRTILNEHKTDIESMLYAYNAISNKLVELADAFFILTKQCEIINNCDNILNRITESTDMLERLELVQKLLEEQKKETSLKDTTSSPIVHKADHLTLVASIANFAQDNMFIDHDPFISDDMMLSITECEAVYNLYLVPSGLPNEQPFIWQHIAKFKNTVSIQEYYDFIQNISDGYYEDITKEDIKKLIFRYRQYSKSKNPTNIKSLKWLDTLLSISIRIKQDNKLSVIEAWDIMDTLIKSKGDNYSYIDFRADVDRYNILARQNDLTYIHNNNYFISFEVFEKIVANKFNSIHGESLHLYHIIHLVKSARYYRLTGNNKQLINMDFPDRVLIDTNGISPLLEMRQYDKSKDIYVNKDFKNNKPSVKSTFVKSDKEQKGKNVNIDNMSTSSRSNLMNRTDLNNLGDAEYKENTVRIVEKESSFIGKFFNSINCFKSKEAFVGSNSSSNMFNKKNKSNKSKSFVK